MTKTPKRPKRPTRRQRARRPLVIFWILGGLIMTAGVLYTLKFVEPAPPKTITMAGGFPGGAYHAFGERYRKALAAEGVELKVRDTAGSVENLNLLSSGDADVAFVQSGTQHEVADPDLLRGIASLYYEPLWIFQKGGERVDRLTELVGKRIAIGAPDSGTRAVVEQLLQLNGINTENAELLELGLQESADALRSGRVDFAFYVSSPDAAVVEDLIAEPQTQLVSIRRHRAYVRNVLFVKDVEIAEGTFDLRLNIPAKDIVVLSTLATLVCRKELHPALVELLARVARDLHSARSLLEKGGEFPSPDYLEFPIHEAASDYFQSGPSLLARYVPFWVAAILKRLMVLAIPLITLLFPLMKIAPLVYKSLMRRRIHKWYDDLDQIEESLVAAQSDSDFDRAAEELDELSRQIEVGIEVPTGFRHDEYDLRIHVGYVRDRIDAARARKLSVT